MAEPEEILTIGGMGLLLGAIAGGAAVVAWFAVFDEPAVEPPLIDRPEQDGGVVSGGESDPTLPGADREPDPFADPDLEEAMPERVAKLSVELIVRGVKRNAKTVMPCLKRAKASGELQPGKYKLILDWLITPDGGVTSPRFKGPDALLGTELARCFEAAMLSWRFPASERGAPIKNFPFGPFTVKGEAESVIIADPVPDPPADDGVLLPPDLRVTGREDTQRHDGATGCQRSSAEILAWLRQRLRSINTCVQAEKARAPETLPASLKLSFVVKPSGEVADFTILDRRWQSGPLASCIAKALTGAMFAAVGGANCPVTIPIKVGG